MSWLDDMAKNIKEKSNSGEKLYDLSKDEEEIAALLAKKFDNATSREINNAISYLKDKLPSKTATFPEILKIVQVKLED